MATAIFRVGDVFYIEGRGVVAAGRVESGLLRVGMKADINGKSSTLKSITGFHVAKQEASEGDNVGLLLSDIKKEDVSRGQVIEFE